MLFIVHLFVIIGKFHDKNVQFLFSTWIFFTFSKSLQTAQSWPLLLESSIQAYTVALTRNHTLEFESPNHTIHIFKMYSNTYEASALDRATEKASPANTHFSYLLGKEFTTGTGPIQVHRDLRKWVVMDIWHIWAMGLLNPDNHPHLKFAKQITWPIHPMRVPDQRTNIETAVLAVRILDHFLSQANRIVMDLIRDCKMLALACLRLASKINDCDRPPKFKELCQDEVYPWIMKNLNYFETQILETLDFKVTLPTFYDFASQLKDHKGHQSQTEFFRELAYQSFLVLTTPEMAKVKQSMIGCAVVGIIRGKVGTFWSKELETLTGYKEEHLISLINSLWTNNLEYNHIYYHGKKRKAEEPLQATQSEAKRLNYIKNYFCYWGYK